MPKDSVKIKNVDRKIKYILYALGLFLVLVGLFGVMGRVWAADPVGTCTITDPSLTRPWTMPHVTNDECNKNINPDKKITVAWTQDNADGTSTAPPSATDPVGTCVIPPANGGAGPPQTTTTTSAQCPSNGTWTATPTTPTPTGQTEFEKQVSQIKCSMNPLASGTFWPGCFVQAAYGLFYVIPAFLLLIAAKFFNTLVALTVYSTLFTKSTFIPTAWAVVRDLSNLFFILILLYIAIQIILDMGHDAKKMIVRVIIIALLINFSMFFTEVVIDTSNIVALIFYNKLNVDTKNPDGSITPRPYDGAGKDISGGMVSAFNPTSGLTWQNFFKQARTPMISDGNGGVKPDTNSKILDDTPAGIILGLLLVTGAVMFFAIYAFFISGIAFVGRLIELWVLIIFSPFAFMSSTIPLLDKVEYIGWDSWFKRLLTVAFMAPIFMFFMYFIFLMIRSNIFGNLITNNGIAETLLLVIIPAMVILILLIKATDFAKKGSGVLGEKLLAGAKMVGGFALGAATGGAALLGTKTIGGYAQRIANNDELRAKAAAGDRGAQRKLAMANSLSKNSFDFRQTGLGKFAAKQSGMDFSKGTGALGMGTEKLKGGQKERDKRATAKEEERIESYKMTKTQAEKQNERAAIAQNQNNRAAEYEADKKRAQETYGTFRGDEEAKFKEAYEKGDTEHLKEWGVNKKVGTGSVESVEKVKTVTEVNNERRVAYANSLDKNNEQAKDAVKTFYSEFKKGAGVSTGKGMAATIAAGIATGGVSTLIQAGAGLTRGLAQGLRAGGANLISDDTKSTFLVALRDTIRPTKINPEIVATIRKEDPNKEFKKILNDLKGGNHVSEENKGKVAERIKSAGSPPAATPPPAAHH